MDEADSTFLKFKQAAEDSLTLTVASTEPIFVEGTVATRGPFWVSLPGMQGCGLAAPISPQTTTSPR